MMSNWSGPRTLTWIWKAFGVVPLLYWPTSSQVTVMVLVAASKSYQTRFDPVDVPPVLGVIAPTSVSTLAGQMPSDSPPTMSRPSLVMVTLETAWPSTWIDPPLKSAGMMGEFQVDCDRASATSPNPAVPPRPLTRLFVSPANWAAKSGAVRAIPESPISRRCR
jgi:hypothetical protein